MSKASEDASAGMVITQLQQRCDMLECGSGQYNKFHIEELMRQLEVSLY